MRHLRTIASLLPLVAVLTGCSSIVAPSELRPAPHPLLERPPGTRPAPLGGSRRASPAGDPAAPGLAAQRRASVLRALRAREGATGLDDLGLVRAAFAEAHLERAPEAAVDVRALRRRARVRQGKPRPADLVFFEGEGFGPRVGVVDRVHPDGGVEALFVTRGAVRRIRIDLRRPHARRVGKRIVNSFLRPKRRGDPPRTAHLAGQLVESVRTLLD